MERLTGTAGVLTMGLEVLSAPLSSTFAILPASEWLAEGVEEELAEPTGEFFHSLAVAGM